jgi:hypothetical protein
MLHTYKRMFVVDCVLLFVLMKSWCKLPEDGDDAEAYRSYVIERVDRLQNCAFFGFTRVLMYHNAQNEESKISCTCLTNEVSLSSNIFTHSNTSF